MQGVDNPMLNPEELKRYVRQITIPSIGFEGQKKLAKAKVLVVGAGGLGSPALYYLAAAGVGVVGIVDPDVVEPNNLNRQIVHFEKDLGEKKVKSAEEKLRMLNSTIVIKPYPVKLSEDNAQTIIKNYDFVIEASDSFETKFLVNDVCVKLGIPLVIGGVLQFEGQLMTVLPGISACYRCVIKDIPEEGTYPTTCEMGIIGTTAGVFGVIEANEAIKYLLFEDPKYLLTNKMLYLDLLYNTFEVITVEKDPNCKSCRLIKGSS